jgi:hypothetical protein
LAGPVGLRGAGEVDARRSRVAGRLYGCPLVRRAALPAKPDPVDGT